MKILHISATDNGGAGLAALRLHNSLLKAGVDSKMLVAHKFSYSDDVFVARSTKNLHFVKAKLSQMKIKRIRDLYNIFYSSPISAYDLTNNPLVIQADVIHLHWIAGFVDYKSFFPKINKPIVWTFHDDNAFLGGFHYSSVKQMFYSSLKKIEDKFCKIKYQSIKSASNLSLVAISDEMKSKMLSSELFGSSKIFKIHNSVDQEIFDIKDKTSARHILNISHKSVFLFVSVYLHDQRKGLNLAIEALEKLNIPDSVLFCVGLGKMPVSDKIKISKIDSVPAEILPLFYSAADFLLFPSSEETFAQTPLEAFASGTPVIMFPISGADQQINDSNGVICKDFTVDSFAEGIKTALNRVYNAASVRQDIINRFNPQKIAEQYLNVYQEVADLH